MQFPPRNTPWGPYTFIREVIPGVWRVATVGHGGFWVSPERLREMPELLVKGATGERPFGADDVAAGWFEEDLEAARVAVAFGYSGHAGAFAGGIDAIKRGVEMLRARYPQTVAGLADWFAAHVPGCVSA